MCKKNELYHHGIKDQKWGVRRYQNPDGSLTLAGKERYLSGKLENDKKFDKIGYQKSVCEEHYYGRLSKKYTENTDELRKAYNIWHGNAKDKDKTYQSLLQDIDTIEKIGRKYKLPQRPKNFRSLNDIDKFRYESKYAKSVVKNLGIMPTDENAALIFGIVHNKKMPFKEYMNKEIKTLSITQKELKNVDPELAELVEMKIDLYKDQYLK